MDNSLLMAACAVFVLAGVVKGVAGMGLPTLSMALLGLLMPPAQAAALMVLPSLATNVAQCMGPHARELAARLWPLWLALAAATVLCPLPDLASAGPTARLALGTVLVVYGLWGLARPALPDLGGHARWLGAVAGGLSGVLTATTGVFVMPLVPYLQALKLPRDTMIQALGLSFMVATLALMLRLGRSDLASILPDPVACALATPAALAGLAVGNRLRRHMQPATFQRALYAVFVLLGALMLAR